MLTRRSLAAFSLGLAGAVSLGCLVPAAQAESILVPFERLEANAPVDTFANYQLTISSFIDNSDEWVRFRFDHFDATPGIENAHLRRVFWEDRGGLFWDGSDPATLNALFNAGLSHPDVSYQNPFVSPAALPGQGQVGWSTSFLADALTPQPNVNAINSNEWGVFDVQLFGGSSFADVQDQLFDQFRVGIHVISIEVDGFPSEDWSDSFLIVPLPPAAGAGLALLVAAGIGAGVSKRRRAAEQ